MTSLLQAGRNCLGATVGHGWGSNTHVRENMQWDRQFIALLSITDVSGRTTVCPSRVSRATVGRLLAASAPPRAPAAPLRSTAAAPGSTPRSSADALQFTAAAEPITHDGRV